MSSAMMSTMFGRGAAWAVAQRAESTAAMRIMLDLIVDIPGVECIGHRGGTRERVPRRTRGGRYRPQRSRIFVAESRGEPTTDLFRGHRIRPGITGSDFPNDDRNHYTAADQDAGAILVVADRAVYHG